MNVIDMHCDTIAELFYRRRDGKASELRSSDCRVDLEKMKKGDYMLQNFALFTCLDREEKPFEYCMKLADLFHTEMEKNKDMIRQVWTYEDIEMNRREGKMSALLTIEEGAVCQGELAFLRNFYRLGVRMMTLTWNFTNELAYPNRRWEEDGVTCLAPDTEHGLTEKGIEFVQEMEKLGMIIDISHLGDKGIEDVFQHTSRPFVASHSNARSVASHPRNLTDDMIRRLSERGGVAGINYCIDFLRDWEAGEHRISRIDDMIRHMKHMKQVGGIQCIGLGSDFDGIEGELELATPGHLPILEDAMKKAGFTESEIEAVFYKNALRVYKEILK